MSTPLEINSSSTTHRWAQPAALHLLDSHKQASLHFFCSIAIIEAAARVPLPGFTVGYLEPAFRRTGCRRQAPPGWAEACVSPSRVPFGVSRHVSKLYWIPSQDSPPHVFSPSAPCGAVRLVRLPLFSHLNLSSHSLEPPVSLRFPLFLSARSLSALLSNLIC